MYTHVIFFFNRQCFGIISKKVLPNTRSQTFFYIISSRSGKVVPFKFRPMVNFELIICMVEVGCCHFYFNMNIQLLQHRWLKLLASLPLDCVGPIVSNSLTINVKVDFWNSNSTAWICTSSPGQDPHPDHCSCIGELKVGFVFFKIVFSHSRCSKFPYIFQGQLVAFL